jgi:trehalose 6-phosphate synthase
MIERPPSAIAPIANSGWKGTPTLRTRIKSSGASSAAGFCRVAGIGLVTPLHDGMNLVAEEYVAAQNPFDPLVLVLSSFAGAAKELDGALQINPYDIDDIARQITTALTMSLAERCERWQSIKCKLNAASVQNFVNVFF